VGLQNLNQSRDSAKHLETIMKPKSRGEQYSSREESDASNYPGINKLEMLSRFPQLI